MSGRVYIASSLSNAAMAEKAARGLEGLGYTITYAWWVHGSVQTSGDARIREVALAETKGVLSADVVLVLLPGGRGTHVELGLALGSGTRVVLFVGDSCLDLEDGKTCAFYLHPLVTIVRGAAFLNPWWGAVNAACRAAARSKAAKKAAVARKRNARLVATKQRARKADHRPRTPTGRIYSKKVIRK